MVASVLFGLFVVFDLVLFGWLIMSSLSQREIEKVLLETREEAEPLAEALESQAAEHEGDIWVVVSLAQETRTYIEDVLSKRETVRKIEIRDRDGRVVYGPHWSGEEVPVEDDVPRVETRSEGDGPAPPFPSESVLEEVEVPIGDLGTLVIGLSEEEVQKRIAVLRRDLIRQTTVIALLTVTLLSAAFVAAWKLFHRARQSEEQVLEAERLAYIGTLASGLAHEIRNPLNSLSLNMQMLEEESRLSGSEGSQLRLLSLTRTELARLERLATDFLSYAKPRPLELRAVPVVELLERVLAVLAAEVQERRADVEIEDRSHGAEVEVDRGQVNQLLLNLAQNALAAAAEGEGPPEVRLVARREEDEVVIEVRDNGPGIPTEERQRIFDLFYSNRKGGTGLGLAIVQRIARAHGTEVEVGGEPGAGAVLSLRLPVAEEREEAPIRAASVATGL